MVEFAPFLVPALSFAAVAAIVFVAAGQYSTKAHIQRRLPTQALRIPADQFDEAGHPVLARYLGSKRFELDATTHEKLRRKLLQAGYFSRHAVNIYVLARILCLVLGPAIVYVFLEFSRVELSGLLRLLLIAAAGLISVGMPDIYLARRRRWLAQTYRHLFPDLLDLLVVCVDAGLGLEAAFERVRREVSKQSKELGTNLEIMGAEMRAGRSTVDALDSLAGRLGLDEAGSLVAMLRQSIELGSDIADALRVFSDEMRDKRLLRAEEAANKLSVKMVIPLGLFIFPVVLLVTILPVLIKLLKVLGKG